jgi:hypothetical protein
MLSGLTLGFMSMDVLELEVLRRSGSEVERRQADAVIPLVKEAHFLLVQLLWFKWADSISRCHFVQRALTCL